MLAPKIIIQKGRTNWFSFRVEDESGEILLDGNDYQSKENCEKAIAALCHAAQEDSRYRKNVSNIQFFFAVTCPEGSTLAKSRTHADELSRDLGVDKVKRALAHAALEICTN